MKVWLNDLKPGDKFWICDWTCMREVEVVGPDPDPTYLMGRVKLSNGYSMFVNQYVFTTKEEAIDDFIPKLKKQLELLEEKSKTTQNEIDACKKQITTYEKCLN